MSREIFQYPPLQLVVFEARLAGAVDIGRAALEGLAEAVGEGSRVQFGVAALRVADAAAGPEAALFQIVDASATMAVTMWPTSLVVETTEYEHFEAFRDLVMRMFAVVVANARLSPRFARIGLRYVDELHPDPPVMQSPDWTNWLNPRLVGLTDVARRPVGGFGGGLSLDLGDDCGLSFRFATLAGPAVESTGPLQLRPRPATPAVVLDTDGFWQPADPETLDVPGLGALLKRLHDGVRELFDDIVTERSLALFRGELAQQ